MDEIELSMPSITQPSMIEVLPDHILQLIHSYMDPITHCKSSQTCKLFTKHSLQNPAYVALIKRAQAKKKQDDEVMLAMLRERDRVASLNRARCMLQILFYGKGKEFVCVLSLLLFTVLLTLKLDQSVEWTWEVIFIPLLPIFYWLIFTPLAFDITSSIFHTTSRHALEQGAPALCSELFFEMAMHSACNRNRWNTRFFLFTPLFSLFIFFILLALQLGGTPGLHSWHVMLPLLVLPIYLTWMILVATWPVIGPDGALLISGVLMLFTFFIIILLKLATIIAISWAQAFIPLFSLTGLGILLAVWLLNSHRLASEALLNKMELFRTAYNNWFFGKLILFIVTPLMILEMLLVVYLEHQAIEFAIVVIPLVVVEGMLMFCCCFMWFK